MKRTTLILAVVLVLFVGLVPNAGATKPEGGVYIEITEYFADPSGTFEAEGIPDCTTGFFVAHWPSQEVAR